MRICGPDVLCIFCIFSAHFAGSLQQFVPPTGAKELDHRVGGGRNEGPTFPKKSGFFLGGGLGSDRCGSHAFFRNSGRSQTAFHTKLGQIYVKFGLTFGHTMFPKIFQKRGPHFQLKFVQKRPISSLPILTFFPAPHPPRIRWKLPKTRRVSRVKRRKWGSCPSMQTPLIQLFAPRGGARRRLLFRFWTKSAFFEHFCAHISKFFSGNFPHIFAHSTYIGTVLGFFLPFSVIIFL